MLRKIRNNPFHFWVNFIGLFAGFTAILLISAFLHYEFNTDRKISEYNRIFLLGIKDKNHQIKYLINNNVAPTLKNELSFIQNIHFYNVFDYNNQHGDHVYNVRSAFIDSNFFQTFDFRNITGNRQSLQNISPGHAVITDKLAEKIFGRTDVQGMSVFSRDNVGYVDTYIIDEVIHIPQNTNFRADMFISENFRTSSFVWKQTALLSYQWVVLKNDINERTLEKSLQKFSADHGMPEGVSFTLKALPDIHFSNENELQLVFQTTNIQIIYLLALVTLMILAIVIINYINFSLHHFLKQSKELGIRKVMGARKGDLFRLFSLTAGVHFLLSVPLACYTAYLLLPKFGELFGIRMTGGAVMNSASALVLLFTIISLLLFSWLYFSNLIERKVPALIRDVSQKPFTALFGLRKGLVVAQLCLSTVLIIVSIGIYKQTDLLREMPIGFNSDYLIVLPESQLRHKYNLFKTELLSNPDVISYTTSNVEIGALQKRNDKDSLSGNIEVLVADFDFLKTLDVPLVAGKDFDKSSAFERKYSPDYMLYEPDKEVEYQRKTRERPIIVSENLVDAYKIENPVGKVFTDHNGAVHGTIVGVCKAFELGPQKAQNSLKVLYGDYDMFYGGFGYVRIRNANIQKSLSHIEKIWKKYLPDRAFSFTFADSKMDRLYQTETAMVSLIASFAVLSVILSTLGVLGLLVIFINQRTREIGIRKVLGASVWRLILLMLHDIVLPLIVAICVAIPAGALILHTWLSGYAYRINITVWIFIIAVVFVVLTTGLPVILKTFKTARSNPVKSLRSD